MSRDTRPGLFFLPLLALGCPSGEKPDDSATDSTPDTHDTETVGDEGAQQALYVEDGPADLAARPEGGAFITTQYGGHVLSWTPGTSAYDIEERSVSGLMGIELAEDGRIWAAASDGGMEGAVGFLEDGELVELASQADNGALFRYPRDVVVAPDGYLVAPDSTVGVLWRTDPSSGATTALEVGVASPRKLLFVEDTLYLGGSEGIYTVAYPAATTTQVDTRDAWGLLDFEGMLLAANADSKVFVVGGSSIGGSEIGRPGPMLAIGDTLYVSDLGGSYLWSLDMNDWSP